MAHQAQYNRAARAVGPTILTTTPLRTRCGSDRRSGRLKAELLEGGAFLSVDDARTELFDYIEVYYNRERKHSSLGYRSSEQFEKQYYTKLTNSVCR